MGKIMEIKAFFDADTYTMTYVVYDPASHDALIIDPVLDYDPVASKTTTRSLQQVAAFLHDEKLRLHCVLETHAHADHLSGSQWLKTHFDARVAIGERIREVQATFRDVFDLPALAIDGSQFDTLLADGQTLTCGTLTIETIATPGHTPACVTYKLGDALFTGDALFMHDYGTGRCDFPSGSAAALFDSIQRLYRLPDATRVFVGHDYQPGGRAVAWQTTIGRSKAENPQLRATTTKEAFVAMREARDKTLAAPRLLYQSVQVNIDAGRLPEPHANGRRYLAVPITAVTETIAELAPQDVAARGISAIDFVDVREPDEFTGELGHVPGARLVPLATLPEAAVGWSRDRDIVVVCRSGARSTRAITELAKRGFSRLYNLRGGMLAWNQAHLPVEH